MNIGIIGTGAIAEAVVVGLCKKEAPPERILLSPRNEQRATRLANKFTNVSIATDNQAVLDESTLIFLAVRPQVVDEVLTKLRFRDDQRVLSFMAGVSIERLKEYVKPTQQVVRMNPLPAIARHEGPILMSPPSQEMAELFQNTGSLIQVEEEAQLETLCAVTGFMAPYFGLLDQCTRWLVANGIDDSAAFDFVRALYESLGRTPQDSNDKDFGKVATEHATPEGFNEHALRELNRIGWYNDISDVLSLLNRRLEGKASFEDRVTK